MIPVTLVDGREVQFNRNLIESIEATPDTVVQLTTGRCVLIRESVEELSRRIRAYDSQVHGGVLAHAS